MERKLLLPIAVLLLFAFNTSAETVPDLPALPINSSIEVAEQNDGEDVSFWKKILNFFSFSKEKKEDIAEKEVVKEEKPSEDIATDIPEFDSNKLQIKRLDEEGSVAEAAGSLNSEKANSDETYKSPQENETPTIPNGFEEDGPLKLPEGLSELIKSVEAESEENNKENNTNQPIDVSKAKLQEQEAETNITDKNFDPEIDSNQKTDDTNNLKLPDGFDNITIEDSQAAKVEGQGDPEQGLEKIEEDKKLPLETTNELDIVPATDNLPSDNSADVPTENPTLPAEDVQTVDKPADNLSENGAAENNSIPDEALPIPDYASASDDSQKAESRVEKFAKNLTNKKSEQIELPKITEKDYETNEKGEIKTEAVEIDSTQLQFVNNETQVLILPNDDVVLGELTEHAKIDEMDLYSYIKLFWENYDRLKREPQKEVIERFIEEYDENFNQEKFG
ncbi:MAG: hypothetical protein NWP47_03270 [Rickettsiaceae bacterium]|nr:hypothetical protein [Rickettsiaceae bacterium]